MPRNVLILQIFTYIKMQIALQVSRLFLENVKLSALIFLVNKKKLIVLPLVVVNYRNLHLTKYIAFYMENSVRIIVGRRMIGVVISVRGLFGQNSGPDLILSISS